MPDDFTARLPAGYWQAEDGAGETCGHRHRYSTAAVRCARSLERYYRRRYNERQEWRIEFCPEAQPTRRDIVLAYQAPWARRLVRLRSPRLHADDPGLRFAYTRGRRFRVERFTGWRVIEVDWDGDVCDGFDEIAPTLAAARRLIEAETAL